MMPLQNENWDKTFFSTLLSTGHGAVDGREGDGW